MTFPTGIVDSQYLWDLYDTPRVLLAVNTREIREVPHGYLDGGTPEADAVKKWVYQALMIRLLREKTEQNMDSTSFKWYCSHRLTYMDREEHGL